MQVVATFAAAREAAGDGVSGLVPTMGFLHEGHLSLIARAAAECEVVLVSVFVNPLQFGPDEDLDRYPRDLDRDVELARRAGADVVFAPSVEQMYPDGHATRVSVDALAGTLCGRSRPGHFEGVATVVAKLFGGLQPDRAYFGRKDAQQLAIITRLATDLSFPLAVVGMPIVRERDGLAMSSRNVYLSDQERHDALALSRGLMRVADAVAAGERSGTVLERLAADEMCEAPLVDPEYAELTDVANVINITRLDRPAFLAVAARVGSTRLIDNVHLDLVGDRFVPDRGVRIADAGVVRGGG